ncbi:type II secretion system protein [bacterium]|nr:type II secretion system protein [bacterium]
MKKQAWTLVEMVVALTIIIVVSGLCVSVLKPGVQKNKLFLYAAMRNIVMGNIAVIDKKKNIDFEDVKEIGGIEYDSYCLALSDNFTLKSSAKCNRDMDIKETNMVLPNGTALRGIASEWFEGASGKYTFKDILVDIDGDSGMNTLWVDQFPLRLYSGGEKEGIIWPANCVKEGDEKADPDGRSDYCGEIQANFALDNETITYNIYRAFSDSDSSAKLIASKLSPMEADCGSYAGGGMYTEEQCTKEGFTVKPACLTSKICQKCDSDDSNIKAICPKVNGITVNRDDCEDLMSSNNDKGLNCVILQHKPSSGANIILETLVGDMTSHFL